PVLLSKPITNLSIVSLPSGPGASRVISVCACAAHELPSNIATRNTGESNCFTIFSSNRLKECLAFYLSLEARVGFEPTNGGFADLSLGPLGYRAQCPPVYRKSDEGCQSGVQAQKALAARAQEERDQSSSF